mmetsp:Transcript_23876/g.47715  ORF Transcript_23876/g.47715 Transcript_23876/m.47715 type:complete len:113 (+) Transcript_23876:77-415(+)
MGAGMDTDTGPLADPSTRDGSATFGVNPVSLHCVLLTLVAVVGSIGYRAIESFTCAPGPRVTCTVRSEQFRWRISAQDRTYVLFDVRTSICGAAALGDGPAMKAAEEAVAVQ